MAMCSHAAQAERDEACDSALRLQQQLDGARDRLAAAEREGAALLEESIRLSAAHASAQLELEDQADTIAALRHDVRSAEAATDAARAETAAAEDAARQEAAEAARREQRLEAAAEALRAEREGLQRRVAQLSEDCARLGEVAGARSDALSAHLDLLRSEKAALQGQLADARAAALRQTEELAAAGARCNAAEANADAISQVS